MECLTKTVTSFWPLIFFAKSAILVVLHGFEYTSGLLKLIYHGSKKDTQEH